MDELSTHSIPESIRAGDQRQQRTSASLRHSERRPRAQNSELETNEQDEPVENSEPQHHVDISV